MADEDDDPVVQEVDVYLSKQLADRLYLFQYPVRPAKLYYDDVAHLAARIKPKQQKVELEVSVNIHSPNYSKSKGEQIALNVDGTSLSSSAQPKTYSSDLMDKQLLCSQPSVLSPKRYLGGIYRDGELHITPLKGIIHLRPSFGYLDQADAKGRGPSGETEEVVEEEEPEAKAVTVKFARRETQEAKARRMASYEYISKKRDEEPWIHVHHHHVTAPTAESERNLLFTPQSTSDVNEFQISQEQYLKRLIPHVTEEDQKRPPMPNNVLSLAELKTMHLADQVKALMMNAKILRFSQLLSLLPKNTDPTAALRCLQQVALLVQGCWVVKSEVLYPKDTFSSYSGVPAESLCRGRDYVMWRFTQSREVIRKDVSTVVKLPAEDVKDILEQMSKLKVHKGWEFVLDYDHEFVNRHTEVVQRQQMLWDAKFQQLSKSLKISKADLDRKAKNAELAAASPEKPKRRRTVSRTKSGSERSFSDQSDTDTEGQKDRNRRLSGGGRSRKNSGAERVRKTSGRDRSLSSSQESLTEPNLPVEKITIKKEKIEDMDVAVPSGSTNSNGENSGMNDLKTELNKFVREKLTTRFVLSLGELRIQLHRFLAGCPAGHILATGVSDKLLEQAVYNSDGVKSGQTPQGDPIFTATKVGDASDRIREVLFDKMNLTKGASVAHIKQVLEEKGDPSSENDIRKVLRQYCLSRGRVWILKGSFAES